MTDIVECLIYNLQQVCYIVVLLTYNTGDDGMTSLHLAAQNGHLEVVHAILNQNHIPRKFINLQDEGGWTPLVWACENRHEEIIE